MKKQLSVPSSVWKNPLHFIAFGFGSGAAPIMPGTFGTLMAIPFYLLLRELPIGIYLLLTLVVAIFAIWLSDKFSKEIKVHDHPGMNIDEFVGYFVTMIAAPHTWIAVWLGFVLFRIFDIWKPFPISWLDNNVHGGFGMIIDDVAAGLVALVILQLIFNVLHPLITTPA